MITLSYTQPTTSNGFALNDTANIRSIYLSSPERLKNMINLVLAKIISNFNVDMLDQSTRLLKLPLYQLTQLLVLVNLIISWPLLVKILMAHWCLVEILMWELFLITDLIKLLPGKPTSCLYFVGQVLFYLRIKSCNISHGEHDLYAMHSFSSNELCVDYSRKSKLQNWTLS